MREQFKNRLCYKEGYVCNPIFFVPFSNLADCKLNKLKDTLANHSRKPVGEINIRELSSIREQPNGAYLFYNPDGTLEYVGKNTSRIFIDRIPAHFDSRENAWLNSLPKHIRKINKNYTLSKALDEALLLQILIIGCPPPLHGGFVESVLRGYLKPRFNKTKREFKEEWSFKEACEHVESFRKIAPKLEQSQS